MATIDSLVLELGIDTTKLTKGQKDALDGLRKLREGATAAGKDVEAQGDKTAQFFGSLKRQVLEVTTLFLGGRGAKEFLTYLTNLDASLGRTSKTIGISVSELSTWQGAIEQAGGSGASIIGTLGTLRNAMETFLAGGGGGASFLGILNQFGITWRDAKGNVRDTGETILDLVEAMKKSGQEMPRIAALLRTLPGMNEESLNFFIRGRVAVDKLRQSARDTGGATAQSAEEAQKYTEQLSLLDRAATNLGRTLFTWLGPALIYTLQGLTAFIKAWNTSADSPEGKRIIEEGEKNIRKRFGTPKDADEFLRSILGGSGGLFEPFSKWLQQRGEEYGPPMPSTGTVPMKPGAGVSSPATRKAMDALSSVQGLDRVTALDDAYHKNLGGAHPMGNALDVTIKDPGQSAAVAAAIRAKLLESGINATVINEYANPSRNATGGHIHIGIVPPMSGLRPGAPAAANIAGGGTVNDSSRGNTTMTSETNINNLIVHAEGNSNADGIASNIGSSIRRVQTAAWANGGAV